MIINISTRVNVSNHGVREVECGSFDGGDDGEHIGIDLVEISLIFATQTFFCIKHHH